MQMNKILSDNATIVDRVRYLLRLLDITQEEMAKAGGAKRTTLTNWLAGKGTPTQPVLEAWARQFGLNGHWLLTGEGEARGGINSSASKTQLEREMDAFVRKMEALQAPAEEIRKGLLALASRPSSAD